MALWDPTKIKQVGGEITRRRPVAKAMGVHKCIWCGYNIVDKGDGSGEPVWSKRNSRSPNPDYCASNPMSCVRNYDDSQFVSHFEHPDALHHDPDGFADIQTSNCITQPPHQTAGQALGMFNRGSVSVQIDDNDAALDRVIPSVNFKQIESKEAACHCSDGECGDSDCHTCNPDVRCTSHASCINSIFCPEGDDGNTVCNAYMDNVRLRWGNHVDTPHDEEEQGGHPRLFQIPPDVFHAAALKRIHEDLGETFESNPEDYVNEQTEHYDAEGDYHTHYDDFMIEQLETPLCDRHDYEERQA